MARKALIFLITAATSVFAFAATSVAVDGPKPRLRPNLPAAALPAIALSQAEATEINNILRRGSSVAGITPDSYEQVRLLAKTNLGPLYLIPGTSGACVFLAAGAVCGDPGGPGSRFNALVTLDPSGQKLIGGGVADNSVQRVEIVAGKARALVPVVRGAFSVGLDVPGFRPGDGVRFIAH